MIETFANLSNQAKLNPGRAYKWAGAGRYIASDGIHCYSIEKRGRAWEVYVEDDYYRNPILRYWTLRDCMQYIQSRI